MEKTLVLLKPSCVQRQLIGEIVNRFERRGLRVALLPLIGCLHAGITSSGTRPRRCGCRTGGTYHDWLYQRT